MKITKRQLRRIIKEEKTNLQENKLVGSIGFGSNAQRAHHLAEQPISGRHADQMADAQALSNAHKELQVILHDASRAMDQWVNDNHAILDAAGELDDPESLTIRMDDLRLLLNDLRDEAYRRR